MTAKRKYQVFHPDNEVTVQTMLGIKTAINSENFSDLFEKAGLLDKSPDDWVPLQILLDIFNEMEERGGAMLDFVAIGIRGAQDLEYPPEFLALPMEDKIFALAAQYPLFNRGTIGYVKSEKVADRHILFRLKTPMPDDWWYGIGYGLFKRFLPDTMSFKAYYDTEHPHHDQGGEETLVHFEWWDKSDRP